MTTGVATAYSATAWAWQRGPGRIYDRLAEVLVSRSPLALAGCHVLDLGAGTGAASRAVLAAGAARVVAADAAVGMLAHDAPHRPPATAGDALALPFVDSGFDATVAAFSLNHLADPAAGLREMARVTRSGGALLASSYADDDGHPVKEAVETALVARGWAAEPWYAVLRTAIAPLLATAEGWAVVAEAAGIEARVESIRVPFPGLGVHDLVAWRLGLAQHARFLAGLSPDEREAVAADAGTLLGRSTPPLVSSILVVSGLSP